MVGPQPIHTGAELPPARDASPRHEAARHEPVPGLDRPPVDLPVDRVELSPKLS